MKKGLLVNILFISILMFSKCNCNWQLTKCQNNNGLINNNTNMNEDDSSYGDSFDDLGINEGVFSDGVNNVLISCISGTPNCYNITNNVITFSNIQEDSVYKIEGQLDGNIIIDVDQEYKFDLELNGFSIKSNTSSPIKVLNGNEIGIKAQKDTKNYVYDNRDVIEETEETETNSAIYSVVDLEIGGKGSLIVYSKNNNGIYTKDDLQVQNLEMTVVCCDNALKGNDGVEIKSGNLSLIATLGDGIKTSNSHIFNQNNQKGIISISNAKVSIYAACDGIDSSYNVIVDNETTELNIYTDKYSNYSKEVIEKTDSIYYIRTTTNQYQYSIKYYNSDIDYEWVDVTYQNNLKSMGKTYYYYSFVQKTIYQKMKIYIYSKDSVLSQDTNYLWTTDYLTLNNNYDMISLTYKNDNVTYNWTNYSTTNSQNRPGNFGGMMNEGNSDKGSYSTKGIKAANEIIINNGLINIKSYDDALHVDNSVVLDNQENPLGNITINGGQISIYSNDDGIHAEGEVLVNGGIIDITYSYEGIEGNSIKILDGNISIVANDDGINTTATTGTGLSLSGGYVYIYCNGDGIDSNSKSSYEGINFNGGDAVIISNSSMNSAIDTEKGYKYTAGSIIAIMPRGGMSSEATHCSNFTSIGSKKQCLLVKEKKLLFQVI